MPLFYKKPRWFIYGKYSKLGKAQQIANALAGKYKMPVEIRIKNKKHILYYQAYGNRKPIRSSKEYMQILDKKYKIEKIK